MQNFFKTTMTIAAIAVLGAAVLTDTAQQARAQAASGSQPAATQKKVKDQGESDIWNEASKAVLAKDFKKAIADLDTWKQKYPDSDFKDVRTLLYVQAYNGAGQFNRSVAAAGELVNKNLDTVFDDPKTGPQNIILFLYQTTSATLQLCGPNGNPTPEELAIGEKAARLLMDFNKKPEGTSDGDWATARGQLQATAKGALLSIAVKPADVALAKKDCQTAISGFSKALGDYPDKSFISYNLGRAFKCAASASPNQAAEYNSKAIYQFVRAAATDPTLGGSTDPKTITSYADSVYTSYHGSDEGLAKLKEMAKGAPLAPDGFVIKTKAQLDAEAENELKEKFPKYALWLSIRRQLSDPTTGQQYFEGQMKGFTIEGLQGTVLEGKPECRSKELVLAVPRPDQQVGNPASEITLKLDAPLTGKPEPGQIEFDGSPTAFTPDPFMVTMDVEKAKIKDLKVTPCRVAPARGGAKKGGAATKKKK